MYVCISAHKLWNVLINSNLLYWVLMPNQNYFITKFLTLVLQELTENLNTRRFWEAGGNRKWVVFPFNLSSHNRICIAKYLFSIRDD